MAPDIVRVLGCGANWWCMHAKRENDPFFFRRHAAWFNTTALMSGRRRHDCHIYPGILRFNRTSGFDPEFLERLPGKTFRTAGPRLHGNKIHLLFEFPAGSEEPDAHLVTLRAEAHGQIDFSSKQWRSPGAQPIAVSKRRERYEAMILLGPEHWVNTEQGRWRVEPQTLHLALDKGDPHHAI